MHTTVWDSRKALSSHHFCENTTVRYSRRTVSGNHYCATVRNTHHSTRHQKGCGTRRVSGSSQQEKGNGWHQAVTDVDIAEVSMYGINFQTRCLEEKFWVVEHKFSEAVAWQWSTEEELWYSPLIFIIYYDSYSSPREIMLISCNDKNFVVAFPLQKVLLKTIFSKFAQWQPLFSSTCSYHFADVDLIQGHGSIRNVKQNMLPLLGKIFSYFRIGYTQNRTRSIELHNEAVLA